MSFIRSVHYQKFYGVHVLACHSAESSLVDGGVTGVNEMNVTRSDIHCHVFLLVVTTVTVDPALHVADLLEVLVHCCLLTHPYTSQ